MRIIIPWCNLGGGFCTYWGEPKRGELNDKKCLCVSTDDCSRGVQRRYDMRHEMLTQRALFCHRANTKRGTLTQHFVTHVVPPLGGGG